MICHQHNLQIADNYFYNVILFYQNYLHILHKYHFERLKYDKNDFYSFNLCKNGGKIRLIVKPNENNIIELYLAFISYDHYQDFDIRKVIYYDE